MLTDTAIWILYLVGWIIDVVIVSYAYDTVLKKSLCGFLLFFIGLTSGLAASTMPLLVSCLFIVFTLYRLAHLLRVPFQRMHPTYLQNVTRRSMAGFLLLHAMFFGVYALSTTQFLKLQAITTFLCFATVLCTIGLVSLLMNMKKVSSLGTYELLGSADLPSITVAIPARNETQDLAECLQAFIECRYEKLEIIVYDDCSHEATSDIIKSYAHKGVRFIQGSEPGEIWLPKNAAYDKLAKEANGEYILFCGVDVRVRPDTLFHLVSFAKSSQLSMVSVLPLRSSSAGAQSVVQLSRYLWELALPRKTLGRPAVLSTLWFVKKDEYRRLGGMESVKRMVVPESYFARELEKTSAYRFIRSNNELQVTSVKSAKEQRNTALRVRYPQLHKRPELVLTLVLCELTLLIAPLTALYKAMHYSSILYYAVFVYLFVVPIIAMISLVWAYTRGKRLLYIMHGLFAIPVDLFLANYSMYKYEFGDVAWKERNVCLPVMHVVPSLPKID